MVKQKQAYDKPFMQSLYVDLHENEDFIPQPIHLGFRTGTKYLLDFLHHLQNIGVNHVAINLRFNSRDMVETLEEFAQKILPHFHTVTDVA